MTRIKICGFTNADDCQAAAISGVDALGFNFAAGPRKISSAVGRALVDSLPPFVQSVGLFLNQPVQQVREVMRWTGCQMAQLHGEESAEEIRWLARFFPVIKAYRIRTADDIAAIPADLPLAAVLLDAWSDQAHGGTGASWDYALLQPGQLPYPLILAGGLRPANVGAAVASVRPYAVDAASGVESRPGRKDPALMTRFVTAVRTATV
jgi:phosphoribosylanthranilate isomerase